MNETRSTNSSGNPLGFPSSLQGIVWKEWLEHGQTLLVPITAWFVGLWVLLIFFHPLWILLLSSVFALIAARLLGGQDAFDGAEEFVFALPPTRTDRYTPPMRILYGVVGEGMGHAIRSKVVLEHLLESGHEVQIMASDRAADFLARHFQEVKKIHGLHIVTEENRVRKGKTLWSNVLEGSSGLPRNILAYFELLDR